MRSTRSPKALPRIDDPRVRERILAKVKQVDGPLHSPCWEWTGYVDPLSGYGQIKVAGKTQWVHRASYAAHGNDIPAELTLDHVCHNPLCCNPGHHELLPNEVNAGRRKGHRDYDHH